MEAKDTRYAKTLRWETRLHFWRGLAQIVAEKTVVAVGAAEDGVTVVDGIVVNAKAGGELSQYVTSGEDSHHPGSLAKGESVRLEQTCAYWHECGQGPDPLAEPVRYVVLEADFGYELRANGKQLIAEGEKSAGWIWTAGAGRSLGVAVRDFWEEGPKALRAAADGTLSVECYAHWQPNPGEDRPPRRRTPDFSEHPNLDNWFIGKKRGIEAVVQRFLDDTNYAGPIRRGPFRFGKGRAKTTEILYLFGTADQRELQLDTLAARRDYLIPVVDPQYLASTRALPFVWTSAAESDLPIFEQGLRDMFENWKTHATRYGFLHFGDDQCSIGFNRTVPSTSDDQEYDTAQCLTMQFARTGDPEYLRWASICARHLMDVDQKHPSGELCFHGYAGSGDYHEDPGPTDMDGHPYIAGIVNHYMLTGDRRSLRGITRLAKRLHRYGTDAKERLLTTDGRGLSRAGICLIAIYDLTRDPAHLAPVKRMVDSINDLSGNATDALRGEPPFALWQINHSEMCYHVRELLVRYHAATGDPRTLATLQEALDLYVHDLWDSQKMAWRGMFGAGFDFNMQYEQAVQREPRSGSFTEGATAELGMSFAYAANVTQNDMYLAPLLDSLEGMGADFAKRFGNREFGRRQLWTLPLVSMLPRDWRTHRDKIVEHEVFRASLRESDGLVAWTPDGEMTGESHDTVRWTDSPFGKVLRTYGNSFVTFPAPTDILETPGTLGFWVRKDEAKWDRKPWPWYGELRGLVHVGSDTRETNALDLMMLNGNLWTRLYDQRAWEMVAIKSPSPAWENGTWHHVAVVWNRFDVTAFLDGQQVGHDDRFALPGGGQTTVFIGWRPTNRYGQADYHDLRIFRSALPDWRIKRLVDSTRPPVEN
ncbi:MAG: LamG-like jellyroll fold domain-containing protein [Pirellulales bacterium]